MSYLRSFSELKARRFLKDQMMRPVQTGRIVHAQLFAGPEGTGKKSAAFLTARGINCTGEGEKPCNECHSCKQFLTGNSPNLIFIEPEKNAIRVNVVRDEIIPKVHLRPDSGHICVIIDEADKMNENAQNALLKTLEEAPEYAVFFLITDKPGSLLPTIRSRCVTMRFAPLPKEDVEEILISNGVDALRAPDEAERSEGSPGRALMRIRTDSYVSLKARALEALALVKNKADIAGAFAKIANDKQDALDILDIYEYEARRLMKAETLSGTVTGKKGEKLISAVINARKKLNANVSYQSAMEMMFFDTVSQEDTGSWQR